MKKIVVFFVLVMVFLCSCSNGHKILGTWTDIEGTKWVFSANGKLAYENTGDDPREYRYSIFDGERGSELTIFEIEYLPGLTKDQKFVMEFSKDGKTLRLTKGNNIFGWNVAGPGWSTNQLSRK